MRELFIDGRRIADDERQCQRCGEFSPASSYYKGRNICRACIHAANRRRYAERYSVSVDYVARRSARSKQYYRDNKSAHNARVTARYRANREAVLRAYGGRCACCGESRREFLAIDHVHGGGNKHRRAIGIRTLTLWIARNGFPPGFQVLCHNCNMAKGIYGSCPHGAEERCAS